MSRRTDLIVFITVLGAGITLIALGVSPNDLSTIAVALSGLYGGWHGRNRRSDTKEPDDRS
ncbi:hypothetical protein ACFO3J_35815 [Streptomyces polygonati]|uniref:Secreted protein n=1 Tax=Streptomyces polygonati TaxID=1617087 RepID=A0ABV8HXT4_9ACTN